MANVEQWKRNEHMLHEVHRDELHEYFGDDNYATAVEAWSVWDRTLAHFISTAHRRNDLNKFKELYKDGDPDLRKIFFSCVERHVGDMRNSLLEKVVEEYGILRMMTNLKEKPYVFSEARSPREILEVTVSCAIIDHIEEYYAMNDDDIEEWFERVPTPFNDLPIDHGECVLCDSEDSVRRKLWCGHAFGAECLLKWANTKEKDHETRTCPMCRAPF